MGKKSILFLIIAVLLVLPKSIFASDVDFPLIHSFSYFPFIGNDIQKKGEYEFTMDLQYSNVYMYNYERDVINDFETCNVTFGLRYFITERFGVEFFLKTAIMYGGIMDKLIIDFHKLFGLNEGGRNEYKRNVVNYTYKDVFSYEKSMVYAGPFIGGIIANIYNSDLFNINFRVSLGIPLLDKTGLSSGNPFLSTGFIFLFKKENFSADFSIYGSFYKLPDWAEAEDIGNRMFFLHIKGEYKKIFGGFLFRSTPFPEGDLSNPAYQLYIGYKLSNRLSISMYEEIPPMDTVPDVTFRIIYNF